MGGEDGNPAFSFRGFSFETGSQSHVSGRARTPSGENDLPFSLRGAGSVREALEMKSMGRSSPPPLVEMPDGDRDDSSATRGEWVGSKAGLFPIESLHELNLCQRVVELAYMEVLMQIDQKELTIFEQLPGLSRYDLLFSGLQLRRE